MKLKGKVENWQKGSLFHSSCKDWKRGGYLIDFCAQGCDVREAFCRLNQATWWATPSLAPLSYQLGNVFSYLDAYIVTISCPLSFSLFPFQNSLRPTRSFFLSFWCLKSHLYKIPTHLPTHLIQTLFNIESRPHYLVSSNYI